MRSRKNPIRWKLAAIGAVATLVAAACSSIGTVEPNASGEVVFTLTDNAISPAVVRVKPGQTVRFIIKNEGAHTHEFMIGRDPIRGKDYLVERVWTPWGGEDFFSGLDVMVEGGTPMGFTGMEMDMGDGGAMPDEGDEGGMVLLQPGDPGSNDSGEVSFMEFTVPDDAVGTWEIGCFQEAGQHYEDGMRATLIVEA